MCNDSDPIFGLNCCHIVNPFTANPRICCDCNGRCCARFNADRRDCFWPEFTHPKWLCCRTLYGCRSRTRSSSEDDADPDDIVRIGRCGCHRG